jgi:mono/diheme cytochrome c family protein
MARTKQDILGRIRPVIAARLTAALLTAAALAASVPPGAASAAPADEPVSFRLDVQPILEAHCGACHHRGGQGTTTSGLDMSSYATLMAGTKHGAIVVPGDPLTSNLLVLVEGRAHPSLRMPHNQRPLLKQQIAIIRDWIKQGAKDN